MTLGNSVRLDFRSTCDMLDLVQVVSDHYARQAGLDEEAVHWVCVAVRESVINAIKHGNAGDERKRVHMEFTQCHAGTPPGVNTTSLIGWPFTSISLPPTWNEPMSRSAMPCWA